MMKEPCEDCGGKYCMCDACQSMKELLKELEEEKNIGQIISECSGGVQRKFARRKNKDLRLPACA